ncbi:MAG: hypothetical protein ACXWUG_17035 [Polyangiales bacterium]
MNRLDRDDRIVIVAMALVALLCVAFRYLPMVDLPQHYAMVSILRHYRDPAWDFAQRYTFDFVSRPYATVYWLGAALAWVMPLAFAMRVVVALCVVAPFAGLFLLLRATDRPRLPILLVLPFAFGALFHWGFLNFLLGTGMFLGGLALVVRAQGSSRAAVGLAVFAPLLLLTHFHGLVMLLVTAPVFAFAFGGNLRRGIVPLIPAGLLATAFVAFTWRQAEGQWARMSPPIGERIARFDEFLGAGFLDPWPDVFVVLLGLALGASFFFATTPMPPRARAAFLVALAMQVVLYFALPLNTNTATFVSARHALLIALFLVPLFPASATLRYPAMAVFALSFVLATLHLRRFDREARDIDGIIPAVKRNQRILPLIFARSSASVHPSTFPYLHFAGYLQAERGGELSRSFAVVWNVPIRYRSDYARYPIREELEWAPGTVSAEDLRHFDYVLVRGNPSRLPPLREVARSGAFTLYEVP